MGRWDWERGWWGFDGEMKELGVEMVGRKYMEAAIEIGGFSIEL